MPTIEQLEEQRNELTKKIAERKKINKEITQRKLHKIAMMLEIDDSLTRIGESEKFDGHKELGEKINAVIDSALTNRI
mgnify:CR=1 FL=1|jgi:hypothetical protein